MELHDTHCCGIKEIAHLKNHKTAEDAMLAFCDLQFKPAATRYRGMTCTKEDILCTHYLFSAGVYDEESKAKARELGYGSYARGRDAEPYGQEFADYIAKHKLGVTIACAPAFNEAFHADHKVMGWFWTPNVANLRKWYDKHRFIVLIKRLETMKKFYKENYIDGYSPDDYYYTTYKTKIDKLDKQIKAAKAEQEKVKNG